MDEIPVATKKRPTYENFVAECPWCSRESIFNRASDLCAFMLISGQGVSCQNTGCGKPFRIVGDSINSAHEMLIWDCYELIERKHYMGCILNLTQSYEVFFGLFFRVQLIYEPFGADPTCKLADLNRLAEELYEKIKDRSFARMRALFLYYLANKCSAMNFREAANLIANLPNPSGDPKDEAIETLSDSSLVALLKALKATNIHTLRNRIAHKQAYRPTRDEVELALKETRDILFPLTSLLNLCDDINSYRK